MNREALENLVKSQGWALLVELIDQRTMLLQAENIGAAAQSMGDLLGKEFRNGECSGLQFAGLGPERLLKDIEMKIADLKAQQDLEENEDESEN